MLIVRCFSLSHALFISLLATPFFCCASFPQSGFEVLWGGLTPDRMIARVFRTDSKFFRKGGKSKANPQGNYGEENA